MSGPLWRRSAADLVAAYAAGETTPDAILAAVLGRLDAVNGAINAVIALDREGATAAAAASTARWRAGRALGPMDGVPWTIKDNILVKDLPAVWGSPLFADHVPTRDESPVARLRAAGAIILGKTNVPEFTVQGFTDNAVFGPTRNPWNLATTPGGSSGGAVAAVASGIGPLALCTDGGGSIRRPAAHAGLIGFKPSTGMIERSHGFPEILHDFEVAGPIGRTVADIDSAMAILGGASWPASAPEAGPKRILHIRSFAGAPVDPEISASVAAAAARFSELGHQVETIDAFDLAEFANDVWPVISRAGVAWLLDQYPDHAGRVGQAALDMAAGVRDASATDYLGALIAIGQAKQRFAELFEGHDLMLTPAIAALAWPIGATHPPTIDGQPVGPRGHAVFTVFANALGIPAVTLPSAPAAAGSRIGFQLCGRRGSDRALLAVAAAYEAISPPLPWPEI
ncbi:amidase [Phreatobacter aquaticus]|uniref:Amidase n=1 Tax=Phreatobacter aquaticus TaxID=2570229 RepID=A0A4D7QKM5_9HYPH|nr:amidase [Phreatobacter aquaticus]QCK87595.1 amidase [Phreatobacter aquaticus]